MANSAFTVLRIPPLWYFSSAFLAEVTLASDGMEAASVLLDAVVREAFETIVTKIREGKKLTDSEVLLLVVSQIRREQERGFGEVERRFEEVNRRFEQIEENIREFKEDVNRRFEQIDKRFEKVEGEIKELRDEMNRRFEQVDKRFEQIEGEIKFVSHGMMEIKSDIINLLKEKL